MGTSEAPLERNSGLLGPVTRNGLPREGACLVPAFTSAEDILWLQFLYRTRVEVFCWERKGGMVGVGGTMRDLRRIKDFWNDPWEDWGRDLIRGTQQNCQAASRTCFRLAGVSSGPWARWVMIFCVHPAPPIPWAGCMATGRALHQDMWVCPAQHGGRVIGCGSRGRPHRVPSAKWVRLKDRGARECGMLSRSDVRWKSLCLFWVPTAPPWRLLLFLLFVVASYVRFNSCPVFAALARVPAPTEPSTNIF